MYVIYIYIYIQYIYIYIYIYTYILINHHVCLVEDKHAEASRHRLRVEVTTLVGANTDVVSYSITTSGYA